MKAEDDTIVGRCKLLKIVLHRHALNLHLCCMALLPIVMVVLDLMIKIILKSEVSSSAGKGD